jgi:hypothetical protein
MASKNTRIGNGKRQVVEWNVSGLVADGIGKVGAMCRCGRGEKTHLDQTPARDRCTYMSACRGVRIRMSEHALMHFHALLERACFGRARSLPRQARSRRAAKWDEVKAQYVDRAEYL